MKVILLEVLLLVVICSSTYGVEKNVETYQEEIAPGVIKLTKGKVDTYTPYAVLGGKPASEAMLQLPEGKLPLVWMILV